MERKDAYREEKREKGEDRDRVARPSRGHWAFLLAAPRNGENTIIPVFAPRQFFCCPGADYDLVGVPLGWERPAVKGRRV